MIENAKSNKKLNLKKKKSFIKYLSDNKWLYLMLIPGIVLLITFKLIPMFGVVIAFKKFNFAKGIWGSPWIGLDNFIYIFKSKDFYLVLRNSLQISFYKLLWGFPAPLILAVMLNEVGHSGFKKISQTIIYLPHFISWVIISGIIINFLSPTTGLANHIVKLLGGEAIAFLQQPKFFRSIVVGANMWKETGWGTIIYLASMTGIDKQLYEAAAIDGATRMQRIWNVTLPCIRSTVIVLLILRTGHMLSNGFDEIFMLANSLTYSVGDVFETYTYRVGLQTGLFSQATAIGLFQSLVGFILILGTNRLSKLFNEDGIW
jgi:putative aldouronate transport system permease protein